MDENFTAPNYQRTQDRKIDEFIGICKGVLADNEFNESENNTLIKWLNEKQINDLQVKEIQKNLTNNNDLKNLQDMLKRYIGYDMQEFGIMNASTSLPIEKMLLPIKFKDKSFCLTGKFASAIGNREKIASLIKDQNGIIKSNVILDLDYLVIGELGNQDWIHSNSGRKIEKALKYREKNKTGIKIISEQLLLEYL
jgi:NAD-dependent DNA ligase